MITAAAALLQTRITFQCRSSQPNSKPKIKLSLSSILKIPKLTIKSLRMADIAAGSYANNTLEPTYVDIGKIDKIFSDEQVVNLFAIGDDEKRKIADEARMPWEVQPHVASLVNIIGKELEVIYNKLTATELAVVTSVVQLESQHLAQLAKGVQKLTGARNVRIITVLDPTLLAGFTIRYGHSGSKLVDMSVKKQLDEIAAQLDIGDTQLAAVR